MTSEIIRDWRWKMDTTQLLAERGKTHGDFSDHAEITQSLKRIFYGYYCRGSSASVKDKLNSVKQEAIDMIFHKLGRIAAGDPDFKDHWDDIAGYAKLVADRCSQDK